MKTAFLFPGQGSQYDGMLHALPAHVECARTLAQAVEVLMIDDLSALDSPESLRHTEFVQLCLLIAGVASARALMAQGARPAMVAGHSIGAFPAAAIAGSLDFADALKIVRLRGGLMEKAYPKDYGMVAVSGLDFRVVESAMQKSGMHQIYVACKNAPDQTVLAGKCSDLEVVIEQIKKYGAHSAQMLNMRVPSHCVLQTSVSDALEKELTVVDIKNPVIPYISNTGARLLKTADAVRRDLSQGVSHPVLWFDCMTAMVERGAEVFVEMLPGRVYSGLGQKYFADTRFFSLEDAKFGVSPFTVVLR